jgi:alpha-tubulin suppressor-like RCC1 family protein
MLSLTNLIGFGAVQFPVSPPGELWSTGNNSSGQLGLGDDIAEVVLTQTSPVATWEDVTCGQSFAIALMSNATIWSTGHNNSGQLGQGNSGAGTDLDVFTKIGSASDWASISAGTEHALAVTTGGTLWSTGLNGDGQLGQGNFGTDADTFTLVTGSTIWESVAAGGAFSLAIRTNGTLWSCGDNDNGQLGQGDFDDINTFAQVGSATDWDKIAAGNEHSLAINDDGELFACGDNNSGELGLGPGVLDQNSFVQVGVETDWADVAAGLFFSLALKSTGTLWACGLNSSGQLGLGDATSRNVFTQVGEETNWAKISAGTFFSLAIKEDGTLWATGSNGSGQLGLGEKGSQVSFTNVESRNTWDVIAAGADFTQAISL